MQSLGISEDEKEALGNEKIDQVDISAYLRGIISKDGGSNDDVKSRIAMAQRVFFTVEKKFGRISRLEY